MRRAFAVVAAVPLLCGPALLGTPVAASPPAASLPAASRHAGAGGPALRSVVVTMRAGADLPRLAGGRAHRARTVVAALRADARRTQAPLRTRLRHWESRGRVTAVTRLWISNSVAVTATPGVVRRIAARADVASVRPDRADLVPALAPGTVNQVAIGAPDVWTAGQTGQGVVVASLDSGADVSHADLAGRFRGRVTDWFDPYGQHPEAPVDFSGHGSATLGVLVGGDDSGVTIGTAPGATWIAARVFNDAGAATTSAVHEAFQWVLDPDHDPLTADTPRIVNASWSLGTAPGCDLEFQPDVQALRAAGILAVFPAGNFGPGVASSVSPGNYPEAISVGALLESGSVSSLSGRGPSDCGGRSRVFPDVVAPGDNVLTADRYGFYQVTSGTSVASPHAAGVLALLAGARPGLGADALEQLLVGTAADLGPPGPDEDYGNGRVDAAAAYAALPAPPGFDLAVTPATASVPAGEAATFDVSLVPHGGFAADVSLALTGLPGSVGTPTFTPPIVVGGAGGSTLVVTVDGSATPGSYPLTVVGTASGVTRQVEVTLVVTPASAVLFYSTRGVSSPPGVPGPADDSDVYRWTGATHQREVDVSTLGVRAGADVDGLERADATHFSLSFDADTVLPGLGVVQDEDVVRYDAGTWSVLFDGTAHGLTTPAEDVDAFSLSGSQLYFSTVGDVCPPRVVGPCDDADVYRWDGTSYLRVFDASRRGLRTAADLDGLVWVDTAHLVLSFRGLQTVVPGLGMVQDEDVVALDAGSWSVFFDGTAHGLGGDAALDIDAIDLP